MYTLQSKIIGHAEAEDTRQPKCFRNRFLGTKRSPAAGPVVSVVSSAMTLDPRVRDVGSEGSYVRVMESDLFGRDAG